MPVRCSGTRWIAHKRKAYGRRYLLAELFGERQHCPAILTLMRASGRTCQLSYLEVRAKLVRRIRIQSVGS